MRSRSRERSLYVSDQKGRERENYRRERSRDRDPKCSDSIKRNRDIKRTDSRSRSRDRIKPRDRVIDASRELREVKRVLSNPTGDSKLERDRRDYDRNRSDKERDYRDRTRNDGAILPNTTGRKTSHDEYNRHSSSRSTDDGDSKAHNETKRVRREGSFHDNTPSRSENNTKDKENSKKNAEPISTEKAYDEKEMKEIEQFLAKTATSKGNGGGPVKESSNGKAESTAPNKPTTTEPNPQKEAQKEEEEEEEVDLLWEDEETIALREEREAEERRKKRLEIASKYNNNNSTATTAAAVTNTTTTTNNTATSIRSDSSSVNVSTKGTSAAAALTSPTTKLPISVYDGTKGLPSPKAVVPVVDLSPNKNNNNNNTITATTTTNNNTTSGTTVVAEDSNSITDSSLCNNNIAGNASLTIPTTSFHLAKLALDPTAVEPLPTRDEEERQQLENEKAALLQEERRERGMSDLSNNGYSNTYGAGGRIEFDMFSASPSGIEDSIGVGKKGQAVIVNAGRRAMRDQLLDQNSTDHTADPHLQSNWDDGEGYYKARIGECIGGDRFRILGVVGKGVFSTVLKCVDLYSSNSGGNSNSSNSGGNSNSSTSTSTGNGKVDTTETHVAIKMIRNNDTMRKAAEKEKSILLSIAQADPHNTKYCVRLLTHLDYRNHVAMVFEYQSMNLRETLKKFGKDVGINIGAIRMYGKQLFVALDLLTKLRIVHADIKLDNILCSGDLKQVKLCDFGSAFRETDSDNDPTPYLVSRFYRAPEIILGMQYDRAIDLWSVCVCLYELFTGHVMFPGRTNNEMLKLMMAVKGKIQNKQIKTHMRAYEVLQLEPHFDPDMRFRQYEADPITGKTVLRLIDVQHPTRDLASVLRSSKAGADDMLMVTRLTDFLEKGLNLDPSKRPTVAEALKHPFFSSSSTGAVVGGGK